MFLRSAIQNVAVCFGLGVSLIGAFPWFLINAIVVNIHSKSPLENLFGHLCWAFGYIINAIFVLHTVHSGFDPASVETWLALPSWELALVGWALSLSLLSTAEGLHVFCGGDSDRLNTAVVGLFVKARAMQQRAFWSFPLVALLGGQAAFFFAEYCLRRAPTLVCDIDALDSGSRPTQRCPPPLVAWSAATSCCRVVERPFDFAELLAAGGGHAFAGCLFVKCIAATFLWSEDPSIFHGGPGPATAERHGGDGSAASGSTSGRRERERDRPIGRRVA